MMVIIREVNVIKVIESVQIKGRWPLTGKLLESIESFKFVLNRARMLGEFDLTKDSHSAKLEQRPEIFAKLSFRE